MLSSPARAAGSEPTFSPASLNYGDVAIGQTQVLKVKVLNSSRQSLTIAAFDSNTRIFSVQALKLPLVLAAGANLELSVTFSPTTTGLAKGEINVIVSNSFGQSATLAVEGTGTFAGKPELTITPAQLSFGDVAVGATGTQTAELSASSGSVTVSSVSSSSSLFSVPGGEFPMTIPAGKTVSLNVTFTPQKSGAASGTLSFASNAQDSRVSKSLTGTGTVPVVSLSWDASTSKVSGYNVYRRTSPNGSYTKLNSGLISDTSYTDKTVAPKTSYSYATTAVNSKGQESSYSNQVDVEVP